MPGGRYECRYRAGKTVASAFVLSSGPVGPVVNTAICDTRNTRRYGSDRSFYVCQRDESGATIRVGSSIVCNGVYPAEKTRWRTVIVNAAGAEVTEPSFGTTTDVLTQAQKHYGPVMKVGEYGCRFFVAGKLAREVSVTAIP